MSTMKKQPFKAFFDLPKIISNVTPEHTVWSFLLSWQGAVQYVTIDKILVSFQFTNYNGYATDVPGTQFFQMYMDTSGVLEQQGFGLAGEIPGQDIPEVIKVGGLNGVPVELGIRSKLIDPQGAVAVDLNFYAYWDVPNFGVPGSSDVYGSCYFFGTVEY
jgi:hypothetical protein